MEDEPRITSYREFDPNDARAMGEAAVEMQRAREQMMRRVEGHHGMVIAIFVHHPDTETGPEMTAFNSNEGLEILPSQIGSLLMALGSSLDRADIG